MLTYKPVKHGFFISFLWNMNSFSDFSHFYQYLTQKPVYIQFVFFIDASNSTGFFHFYSH